MFSNIKLLKIVLPLATAASSSIVTASLVSKKRKQDKLNKKNEEKIIYDFEKPFELYEEEIITLEEEKEKNEIPQESKEKLEEVVKEQFKKGNQKELLEKLSKDPAKFIEDILKSQNIVASEEGKKELALKASQLSKFAGLPEKIEPQNEEVASSPKVDKEPEEKTTGAITNAVKEEEESQTISSSDLAEKEIQDSPRSEVGTPNQDLPQGEESPKIKALPEEGPEKKLLEREITPELPVQEDHSSKAQKEAKEGTEEGVDDLESLGIENGLLGENGEDPITLKKLEEFEEIKQEAFSTLSSLDALLKRN